MQFRGNTANTQTFAREARYLLPVDNQPRPAAYGVPGKHFKGSHASERGAAWRATLTKMAEKESRGEPTLITALAGDHLRGKPVTATLYVEMVKIVDAAYHIMERIARGEPADNVDLDCLAEVLNGWKGPIRLQDNGTYGRSASIPQRFAEDFLAYLNLASRYERQHEICEVCGALMLSGRGGKKYCSVECRNKHWNYARQKKHYISKLQKQGGKH